jgi:hypothetical protein
MRRSKQVVCCLAVLLLGTPNVKATDFTTDHTFVGGDYYWSVHMLGTAHAEVLGGYFENAFNLYDHSTANFRGGDVAGQLAMGDSSSANIYPGGYINTYIQTGGSSVLDIYGGRMPDNYLWALEQSTVNMFVDTYQYDPYGGNYGNGALWGLWRDGSSFGVSLSGTFPNETQSHIWIYQLDSQGHEIGSQLQGVPEPSTLTLLGVGAISLLAYTWRRRRRTR